ncbi:hypothetical protein GCM10008931_33090 [Oceanobacillus oncorhynchi subsp. oncorhynchi]
MKRSIEISLSLLGGLAYVFSVGMYMETIDKAYGEPNHEWVIGSIYCWFRHYGDSNYRLHPCHYMV